MMPHPKPEQIDLDTLSDEECKTFFGTSGSPFGKNWGVQDCRGPDDLKTPAVHSQPPTWTPLMSDHWLFEHPGLDPELVKTIFLPEEGVNVSDENRLLRVELYLSLSPNTLEQVENLWGKKDDCQVSYLSPGGKLLGIEYKDVIVCHVRVSPLSYSSSDVTTVMVSFDWGGKNLKTPSRPGTSSGSE